MCKILNNTVLLKPYLKYIFRYNFCPLINFQSNLFNFTSSTLRNVKAQCGSKCMGAFFRGANFLGGKFPGAIFRGVNFLGGKFPGGKFPGGIFPGGKFPRILIKQSRVGFGGLRQPLNYLCIHSIVMNVYSRTTFRKILYCVYTIP